MVAAGSLRVARGRPRRTAPGTGSACAGRPASVLVAVALLAACGTSGSAPTVEGPPTGVTRPTGPSSAAGTARPPDGPAVQGVAGVDAELVAAAYANDLSRAAAAIRAGGDVDAQDASQQSAFLIATSEVGDDPRLLELTLSAGADVAATDSYDGTGLIRAAERGYPRIVARLLDAGTRVDHVNRLGWTALLEAVVLGAGGHSHTDTVRLLIAGGADVDLPDSAGVTALAHAQRRGQREIVDLLQGAGARARQQSGPPPARGGRLTRAPPAAARPDARRPRDRDGQR